VLAPIIVGNVVVWKPSPGAIYSSWLFNQIMIEAGLPAGVLQFLPGDAVEVTDQVYKSRDLGGLHFTGSTTVFRCLIKGLGEKMDFWRSYPRIVGETGKQANRRERLTLEDTDHTYERWKELSSPPPNRRCEECSLENG
jgi:1-pyrroline-5-carboxylate dehydrogenase